MIIVFGGVDASVGRHRDAGWQSRLGIVIANLAGDLARTPVSIKPARQYGGVTRSNNPVVGANTVIKKTINSYDIVAGLPPRIIGKRSKVIVPEL